VFESVQSDYDRTADYEALMAKRNAPRWFLMLTRNGCTVPAPSQPMAA